MQKISKYDSAIRNLSPEAYRVTQENGTEAPAVESIWITKNLASMSMWFPVSRCLPPPTSTSPGAAGQASRNPLSRTTSASCGIRPTA